MTLQILNSTTVMAIAITKPVLLQCNCDFYCFFQLFSPSADDIEEVQLDNQRLNADDHKETVNALISSLSRC